MKICFIGDVFMSNDVLKNMDQNIFWNEMRENDLVILNFEAPVTNSDKVRENKKYNLKVSEQAVAFFKNKSVVLNLANNHIMDFGNNGLQDTITILDENNINYCGIGDNISDSKKGKSVIVNNNRIYVIGAADPRFQPATLDSPGTLPAECNNLVKLIKEARNNHELIIITIHAGTEFSSAPSPYQVELAHSCIDAGADIIHRYGVKYLLKMFLQSVKTQFRI